MLFFLLLALNVCIKLKESTNIRLGSPNKPNATKLLDKYFFYFYLVQTGVKKALQ